MSATYDIARLAELMDKDAKGEALTPEEASELMGMIRAQQAQMARASAVLTKNGVSLPSMADTDRLAGIVASVLHLAKDRAYNTARMYKLANEYNAIAGEYGMPFCDNPTNLYNVIHDNDNAGIVERGRAIYTAPDGQAHKYPGWDTAIALQASIVAQMQKGKVWTPKKSGK